MNRYDIGMISDSEGLYVEYAAHIQQLATAKATAKADALEEAANWFAENEVLLPVAKRLRIMADAALASAEQEGGG